MPSKRPSPLEEPPSASSSSSSSESEEQVEASDEEQEEEKPSSQKKPISKPKSNEDSDEDSDDSDNVPLKPKSSPRASDFKIKPIASKPMNDSTKTKKPTATSATPPSKSSSSSAAKRPLEKDVAVEKDSKKDKKKKKKVSDLEEEEGHLVDTDKKSGEDHKNPFQRLWTEEDEIVILKGMINYKKKGYNPSLNMPGFLDFIKDSLSVDVTSKQLHSKVHRLKMRYQNGVSKAKPGEEPQFSKPHEAKMYQLSKKIWGEVEVKEANNGGGDSVTEDVKKSKSKSQRNINGIATPKPKVPTLSDVSPMVAPKTEDEKGSSAYPYLSAGLHRGGYSMGKQPTLDEFILKNGLDFIGTGKAEELNKRWKEVILAESKTFFSSIDLVREQTKVIIDAIEPSDT